MDIEKYRGLWRIAHELDKTSSILDIKDNSLTFAKTPKYLSNLNNTGKTIHVVLPSTMPKESLRMLPLNVTPHVLKPEDDLKYIFTYIHNDINKDKEPKRNVIGRGCSIHKSAIVGVPGNCLCDCPDGTMMNLKHMGNVVIEDGAEVQALSIVHRACFTSTRIRKNAKIFCMVNIGHNSVVGERTIIAPGSCIAGGTKIGNDCYIWQGVITRSNISICDNVVLGAGSLVLKDIVEPGIYFGSPAEYMGPYDRSRR